MTKEQKEGLLANLNAFFNDANSIEKAVEFIREDEVSLEEFSQNGAPNWVIQQIEQKFWDDAVNENDVMGKCKKLESFVKAFKTTRSEHLSEAQSLLENLQHAAAQIKAEELLKEEEDFWQKCLMTNTIDVYQEYLIKYPNGKHVIEANSKIEEIRNIIGSYEADHRMWEECCEGNTIEDYEAYMQEFPNGLHVVEAKRKIKECRIEEIIKDHNKYDVESLNFFNITKRDLRGKINDAVLNSFDYYAPNVMMGETPESIPNGYTEVYFWGVTGSGKTCTVASILSRLKTRGLYDPQTGPGLNYMTYLSNVFTDEVNVLPTGTSGQNTQYLPMLIKDDQRQDHKVAMIELSGEVFMGFSKELNGQQNPTHVESTLKTLKNYLSSTNNPKYHFFVIDVNNLKKDADYKTQQDYLQQGAMYFQNFNIFNSQTAGFAIIVTKSDLLAENMEDRISEARRLLAERYAAFCTTLKNQAVAHKVIPANGQLPVIPYSIGEVYFQSRCIFDSTMSDKIIDILQNSTRKEKKNQTFFDAVRDFLGA